MRWRGAGDRQISPGRTARSGSERKLRVKARDVHELGSPPGTPLPEGVFPLKSGPPVLHPMAEEIGRQEPEWLYCYCKEQGFNEQSTYSFLRSFFQLDFKAFRALARRVDRAE